MKQLYLVLHAIFGARSGICRALMNLQKVGLIQREMEKQVLTELNRYAKRRGTTERSGRGISSAYIWPLIGVSEADKPRQSFALRRAQRAWDKWRAR